MTSDMRPLIVLALVLSIVLIGMVVRDEFSHPGKSLVILHTSNLRGQIQPFIADTGAMAGTQVGGMSFIKGAIDGVLQRQRVRRDHCLFLDTGDAIFGSPEATLTGGEAPLRLMRLAGYDAMAVGNLEFEFGVETLRRLASQGLPMLACNLRDRGNTNGTTFLPSKIFNVAGTKVGVIGLALDDLGASVRKETLTEVEIRDKLEAINEAAHALRVEGAEPIILVSHDPNPLGTPRGAPGTLDAVRQAAPEIDIVICDGMPSVAEDAVKRPIYCPTPAARGAVVGMIKIPWVGGRWAYDQVFRSTLPIQPRFSPADPRLVSEISTIEGRVDALLDTKVAEARGDFKRQFNSESTMGGIVAASMRAAAQSEIALINSGTLKSAFMTGPITLRDLFSVLPFENRVVVVHLPGWALESLLETSLVGDRSFLQAHGMSCTFSSQGPGGFRIIQVLVGDEPLQWDRDYTVAVSDFMLENQDQWPELSIAKNPRVIGLQRECLQKYLEIRRTVEPATQTCFLDILDDRTLLTQALTVDIASLSQPLANDGTIESPYLRYIADVMRVETNSDFALIQPQLVHFRTDRPVADPSDGPVPPPREIPVAAPLVPLGGSPVPGAAPPSTAAGETTITGTAAAIVATAPAAVVASSSTDGLDGLFVAVLASDEVSLDPPTIVPQPAEMLVTDDEWSGPLRIVTPMRIVSDIPSRIPVEIVKVPGDILQAMIRDTLKQGDAMLGFSGFSIERDENGKMLKIYPWEGDFNPNKTYKVALPADFPAPQWRRYRPTVVASDLRHLFIKGIRSRRGKVDLRCASY